jgi:hypothetical protein
MWRARMHTTHKHQPYLQQKAPQLALIIHQHVHLSRHKKPSGNTAFERPVSTRHACTMLEASVPGWT